MEMYSPGQQIYVTDSQGHRFATVVPIDVAPGATFCVRAPIMSCTSAPVLTRATAPVQHEITAPAREAHATAAPTSTAPASTAVPPLHPAHGGPLYALEPDGAPCGVAAPGQSRKDVVAPSPCTWLSLPPATPDSELSSTALVTTARPSVELHAALISAQIQAELEVGQHVYAKQWARPAVQWGGVQWDASLEVAIAAELFQPSALAELFQPSAHPLPLHDEGGEGDSYGAQGGRGGGESGAVARAGSRTSSRARVTSERALSSCETW